MPLPPASSYPRRLKALCLGRGDEIAAMLDDSSPRWLLFCAAVVLAGCGLYGVSVGLWRSPLQSVYTGLKFPLLVFLTCAGNAALNGMLGQIFGSGLGFRQASVAILFSFTIVACVLAALSPLGFFILLNTPPLDSSSSGAGHGLTLLTHVGFIAYAGVVANLRLLALLRRFAVTRGAAHATLLSWLAGNLLLGAQLAWVLRPFIGSPGLPVEFLREEPLRGNFFEAVWSSLQRLF